MANTSTLISILIVEDEKKWQDGLRAMYEEVFDKECITHTVSSVKEAEDLLRKNPHDLLSLDINLGNIIEPDADGFKRHANGLDLLERAAKKKWVNGVIVISGIQADEHASTVIPQECIGAVLTSLHDEINRFFPDSNITLTKNPMLKNPDWITHNIQIFKEKLTIALLKTLASPSYTLNVSKAEYNALQPKVLISSNSLAMRKPPQILGGHAKFLYLLARKHESQKDDGTVSGDELLSIFFNNNNTGIAINSVKRELLKHGVDPDLLFTGTPKKGFRLVDSVITQGVNTKFHDQYTLKVNESSGDKKNDTITVSIILHRNKRKEERFFSEQDAFLLWSLAITANDIKCVSHKEVADIFKHNAKTDENLYEIAQSEIDKFKLRLRSHSKALDPYKIFRQTDDRQGWELNSEYTTVEGLSQNVYTHYNFDETKTKKEQAIQIEPDTHIQNKETDAFLESKHGEFLKKNNECFDVLDAQIIFHFFNGDFSVSAFASDHKLEPAVVSTKSEKVKILWDSLRGPSFTF